jgi:hypothetical protein
MPSNFMSHAPVECGPSTRPRPACRRCRRAGLAGLVAELGPRLVEIDLERLGEGLDDVGGPAGVLADVVAPHRDRAGADALARIGDDQLGVGLQLVAQAVALDAHAERRVERERLRRQLGEADAAGRAGVVLGVHPRRLLAGDVDHQLALALAQRGLDRVGEAAAVIGADRDPIDHQLDGVLLLLLEGLDVLEADHHAVDPDPDEAGLARVGQELAELALAVVGLGRVQGDLGLVGQRGQLVDHLGGRPLGDRAAALVAALLADARVEHAQVVVDLGDRADRRPRVRGRALLLDGDRRRQAADALVLRLLHLAEELPGVGRQRLDVAALALGVEGVEGHRRLARARRPGDHHELVLGDLEAIDLQVVLAGALDHDGVGLGRGAERRGRAGHRGDTLRNARSGVKAWAGPEA